MFQLFSSNLKTDLSFINAHLVLVNTRLVEVQYLTNFTFSFNFLKELMTKLITETPDQPIPFLIDHLQSKQGNRGQLQRTLSGSAALWAESETSGMFCVLERAGLQYNLPTLTSVISWMHMYLLNRYCSVVLSMQNKSCLSSRY